MLDLASTGLRIHSVFKNFYSGEWIKKLQDSVPYVWTEETVQFFVYFVKGSLKVDVNYKYIWINKLR